MSKIDINNRQNSIILDDSIFRCLKQVAKETIESEGYDESELSITLVDNKEIHFLNRKYREVDEATDVLSFPIGEEILGDVIISVEKAKVQAEEYGHSFARELCYLLTHGILHLCGYTHKSEIEKKKMREKEEKILDKFNLVRG